MKREETYSCPPPPPNAGKTGFTLAEVLITLGIIGIIAALTIPSLVGKYQKKQRVTRLKKAYSVITQAFNMAQIENGPINEWQEWEHSDIIITKYLAPNLKILKNYGLSDNYNVSPMCGKKDGYHSGGYTQYSWLGGEYMTTPFYAMRTSTFELTDGMCIGINNDSGTGLADKYIFVDINGAYNRPNRMGEDLFIYIITDDNKVKPFCHDNTDDVIAEDCPTTTKYGGYCCSEKIIRDGWEIKY